MKPAHTITSPCHVHPSNQFTAPFSPAVACCCKRFASTRCRLRGPSRQSGPPLAAVSKPRDLRSDKNLVYPCRLTKSSRTASQDQWAQMLLACRSVAWQYMDREIVQVFKYKFPPPSPPGSPSNNFIFRVPFRTRAGLIARRSLVLNTILIAVILELTSLGEKSPTPPFIVKSQTLHNKWLIRKFIDDNVCRDFKTRPRRRRIIKLSDVRFLHGY